MRFLLIFFLTVMTPGNFNFAETAEESLTQKIENDTAPAPIPLSFSEEKMASYKEDSAFDYLQKDTSENWWTRLKRYVNLQYHNFLEWLFGDYTASGILLFFIELLPYLVIGAVLYLAIRLFQKLNPAAVFLSETPTAKVYTSEEEEIIKSRDISELIKSALNQKDYRLAIRFYFLLILQQLTEKKIISYEFSKTDQDYAQEIRQNALQEQFKQLIRIYDFIWYGNFDAKEEHYLKSKEEFEKMEELIQRGDE